MKDDFAYDRMVRGFQDAARAALAGAPSETRREQGRALAERLREALRDVAERQREACAEYLTHWTYDEHTLSRVRATPLVTEDE